MSRESHHLHFYLNKKQKITFLDKTVLIAAFLYPLSGVPQAIKVFTESSEGVSILAWFGFIVFSAIFALYGYVHKIKPMVVTNLLWIVVDAAVIVGVLINK